MLFIDRECFFTSVSTDRCDKFMESINHSFGSGGMTWVRYPNDHILSKMEAQEGPGSKVS